MRSQIPSFRLPETVLNEEVNFILDLGIHTHFNHYVKSLKEDNKTFDEQWLCCNDSRVNNISNEEAMSSQNAYILFYSIM